MSKKEFRRLRERLFKRRNFVAKYNPNMETLQPRQLLAADFMDQESPVFMASQDNDVPGQQVITHVGGGSVVDSSSTGATITGADTDNYDFSPAVAGEVTIQFDNEDGDVDANDDLSISVTQIAGGAFSSGPTTVGGNGSTSVNISSVTDTNETNNSFDTATPLTSTTVSNQTITSPDTDFFVVEKPHINLQRQ